MSKHSSVHSISKSISNLLSQMTLDEKLAQLGSYWIYDLQTDGKLDQKKVEEKLRRGIGQITRTGGASCMDLQAVARTNNNIQRFLIENTRLGIPAIVHEECCSGAMILNGSMFPQMLGLAGTFQPELAEQMTTIIRKQLRATGAHQGLAPVLDIGRDPRWGRIEETFGEDPTLISHFGMAYIRGLQGSSLKEGVIATGKHFVGHSMSQGGLNCGPVHMGPHELWDIYLAPFQAAIRDAGLASMMCAYPELDGEVVAASRRILTDLLRQNLGFEGLVVSDYHAINMIHNYHNMAPDKATAAAMALRAGIDVELPAMDYYDQPLKAALESGDISMEFIDTAVRRHLQKKFETGLFENPYVDENSVMEIFETPAQRTLARDIAEKSMVLLKNDGVLPLKKTIETLAVIGPNAHNARNQLGDYSHSSVLQLLQIPAANGFPVINVDANQVKAHDIHTITVLDGIQAVVSQNTRVLYAQGCDILGNDNGGFEEALNIAMQADAVVLVLGDHSGLSPVCSTGETRDSVDLCLPGAQEALARAVIAIGKPVVVVLVNGRPYAIPWLDDNANAILEAWLPGEEGGNAVAAALFGDINPGGKLPITFPRHVGQVPIFYNHPYSGMRSNWYVDYVTEKVTPLYAFGHGLSYTQFDYSDLSISAAQAGKDESVSISFKITNCGPASGDEVVQLYINDEYASSPRPLKELKGYLRLTLSPGDCQQVTFNLPVNQLAFYDPALNLVLEPGKINIMIGASSNDIRLNGSFEIIGTSKIPVKDRIFACPVQSRIINE